MVNKGIAPLDPTSGVGQFRLAFGDAEYEDLEPAEAGFGDYKFWSDLEIQGFLVQSRDSINRAVGYAWLKLSGAAALQSQSVKDYDLAVDLTKRAGELRATAQYYFGLADADDVFDGVNDTFDLFDVSTGCGRCNAELAEWPSCRCNRVYL